MEEKQRLQQKFFKIYDQLWGIWLIWCAVGITPNVVFWSYEYKTGPLAHRHLTIDMSGCVWLIAYFYVGRAIWLLRRQLATFN